MSEQTFLKLKDSVRRPVFTIEKLDRGNESFKKLVNSYKRWCMTCGEEADPDECEQDIVDCIEECRYNNDGYKLTQFLEDKIRVEGDVELVNILDDVQSVRRSMETNLIKNWVKENSLTIPEDVLHKRVNVKQSLRKYENHFITSIRPDTYEVTISDIADKQGGWVINYENVTFV